MKRWMMMLLAGSLLLACGSSDEGAADEPIVLHQSEGGEDEATEHEATGETTDEAPPEETETSSEPRLVVGEDACQTDADCVPAGCCHPAACVAQANAPTCGEVMCTADCRPDTMDCGGGCLCHEGRCAARLAERTQPSVVE